DRELRIEWADSKNKQFPSKITLVGSAYALDHGIKLGMSLAELEKINQDIITFAGFGWDGGGWHYGFGGGKLAHLDSEGPTLSLRYSPDRAAYAANKDDTVIGEGQLFS